MSRRPTPFDALTDEQIAVLILGPVMEQFAAQLGAVRLARVMMVAGLKLAVDIGGEAEAWETMREILQAATERARLAAHPKPKAVR